MKLIGVLKEKQIGGISYLLVRFEASEKFYERWLCFSDFLELYENAQIGTLGQGLGPQKARKKLKRFKNKGRRGPRPANLSNLPVSGQGGSHLFQSRTEYQADIQPQEALVKTTFLENTLFDPARGQQKVTEESLNIEFGGITGQEEDMMVPEEPSEEAQEQVDTCSVGSLFNLCHRDQAIGLLQERNTATQSGRKVVSQQNTAGSQFFESRQEGFYNLRTANRKVASPKKMCSGGLLNNFYRSML